MNILGISSGVTLNQHDPGAALICDGELIACCEEERFVRVKSPRGYLPIYSVNACLKEAGLKLADIDLIAHPGETYEDMPERIRLYCQHYFGAVPKIELINHQLAHLASAFYASGFDESICLSYDAVGDRLSVAFGVGNSAGIKVLETRGQDKSLGIFYAITTSFLGFQVSEDEYKVMGLAAYGEPGIDLSSFVSVKEDDYFINTDFFERNPPHKSVYEPFYNQKLIDLLGPPRKPGEPITQHHKNIAYAAQKTLEKCATTLVGQIHRKTGIDSIALAGGVALNCSANLAISQLPFIKRIFVQPAASDRGLPFGCALQAAHENGTPVRGLRDVYGGPRYNSDQVLEALKIVGAAYEEPEDLPALTAKLLEEGKIIGLWQGRSEFGPRALGNRSILADARSAKMRDEVNARIKFREEFRPFAPAVLEEQASELFEMDAPSPYMTVAFPVRDSWKERLGAVTHVNGTARVQTVNKEINPLFHAIIERFFELSGVPAVLNTSFNVRGQPIVETPLDALGTFYSTGLDALVLDRYLIRKPIQPMRASQ